MIAIGARLAALNFFYILRVCVHVPLKCKLILCTSLNWIFAQLYYLYCNFIHRVQQNAFYNNIYTHIRVTVITINVRANTRTVNTTRRITVCKRKNYMCYWKTAVPRVNFTLYPFSTDSRLILKNQDVVMKYAVHARLTIKQTQNHRGTICRHNSCVKPIRVHAHNTSKGITNIYVGPVLQV